MKLIIIPFVAILATCSGLSPNQQTALNDVTKTAIDAGLGYLSGGTGGAIAGASKDLVTDVQDASLALRTMEGSKTATAPSSAQIQATIATIAGSPAVAKAIGPKVAASIASAVSGGANPSAAIEKAATGLDTAASMMSGPVVGTKF